MRLHLIRHSLTPETGKRLSSVDPEISLSEPGQTLADELGAYLAPVPLTAVYTSPHQRCRQTAAAIARGRGIRTRIDRAFVEADYGKWLGRPLKSLYRLKAWQDLLANPSRFRFPDGETLHDAQQRAVAGVETLLARHPDEQVAVATHGDIVKVIVAHYAGIPLDLSGRINPAPASVTVLDVPRQGSAHLVAFNAAADAGRWA